MPDTTDTPIVLFDTERDGGYYDPDLDFDYIDQAAGDVARILSMGGCADVAYQPGDGTKYGLVFIPLRALTTARPRTVDGVQWDAHAVGSMARLRPGTTEYEYDERGVLITWVENGSYPLSMFGRGGDNVAADYIAEHWRASTTSAGSLALLFRTISWHLDNTYRR